MHLLKLHLQTADLAATQHFYAEILGLPTHPSGTDRVTVVVGTSTLVFHPAPASEDPFYHVAFTVPANQIAAAQSWLQARLQLLPVSETDYIADFRNWEAKSVYFHDASGNILECIARAPLQNSSTQPFGPDSLLGLSEVGLVVPDVPAYCRLLEQTHRILPFPRGPVLPEFATLGTDEGLLIVSGQGRGWVPTRRPAVAYPLHLTLRHQGTSRIVALDWPPVAGSEA